MSKGSSAARGRPSRIAFKRNALSVLIAAALAAGSASAQVGYVIGAAPTVGDASQIIDSRQANNAPGWTSIQSIVTTGSVVTSIDAGGLVVTSSTDSNVASAAVDGNLGTASLDLMNASGSTDASNAVVVGVQENDLLRVFARIQDVGISSAVTEPDARSTISLSGNTIAADVDLNDLTQTLQGQLNPAFANGESGVSGNITIDASDGSIVFAGLEAGLLVGSAQVSRNVEAITPGNVSGGLAIDPAYSVVKGSTSIGVAVDGLYDPEITVTADANTISAGFTANSADNLLEVRDGLGTDLRSSAGVVNVQGAYGVGLYSGTQYTAALVAEGAGRIGAVVDGIDTRTFADSTLSFDSNAISASATGSTAENDLVIAPGIDVDAPNGALRNSLIEYQPGRLVNVSGGLFTANVQRTIEVRLVSTVDGTNVGGADDADLRVYVAEGLADSTVTADGNAIRASSLGNDADTAILVGGGNAFASTVSAANMQVFGPRARPTPATDVADASVEANVQAGDLQVDLVGVAGDILGASVSIERNAISALAVANRDPLSVSIAGSAISDDGFSAAAVSTVDSTLDLDGFNGDDFEAAARAGFTASSVQRAGIADTTVSATTSVTASAIGAAVLLDAGNGADSEVAGSSFSLASNTVSAVANVNENVVSLAANAATSLDASAAVIAVQLAEKTVTLAEAGGRVAGVLEASEPTPGGVSVSETTLTVGDADLGDRLAAGNVIAASAAGQVNSASLSVSAGTELVASDVAAAPGDNLALDLANGRDNRVESELSVLTDQRITEAGSSVAAQTTVDGIAGRIDNASQAVAGTTLAVDGNRVSATARGNVTANALAVDAASASIASGAGSNLASMGSVQSSQADGASIRAEVLAPAGTELLASVSGTGDVSGTTVSANANVVSAFALAGSATNAMDVSGTRLLTGSTLLVPPAPTSVRVGAAAAADSELELSGAALATGVLQANTFSVSALIADAQALDVAVAIGTSANGDVSGSTLSASGNTVLSQLRGVTASTTTALGFSDIESSAAIAVRQSTNGTMSAGAGTDPLLGGAGSVTVSASLVDTSDGLGVTVGADENTVGAEAVGAVSNSTLAAAAANRLASGSTAAGATTIALGAAAGFEIDVQSEFSVVTQQSVGGTLAAGVNDASVAVSAGDLANASVSADGNLITAQMTGGTAGSRLNLAGSDLAFADPANGAAGAVVTDQALNASVSSAANSVSVTARVADLSVGASGANGTESVSVDGNTLSVLATGLQGNNALGATASGGIGGAAGGTVALDLDASAGGELALAATADQTVASNQVVAGDILVISGGTFLPGPAIGDGMTVALAQQSSATSPVPAVLGDTLTVDRNTLLAQGIGATNANQLSSRADGGSTASAAIVAVQELLDTAGLGAVAVFNFDPMVDLAAFSTVESSTLSVSGNAASAAAIGLSGSNRVSSATGGSLFGTVDARARADLGNGAGSAEAVLAADLSIASEQRTGGDVIALTGQAAISLATGTGTAAAGDGAVTASTLRLDANRVASSAAGASTDNQLALDASNALSGASALIASGQSSASEALAGVGNYLGLAAGATQFTLRADGSVGASTLSADSNSVSARATNLAASNTLSATAGTQAGGTGDPESTVAILTANRATTSAGASLIDVNANRAILSDQFVAASVGGPFGLGAGAGVADASVLLQASGGVTASTLSLQGNANAAEATIASVRNALSSAAGTDLLLESAIVSLQESAADAEAAVANVDLLLRIGNDAAGPFVAAGVDASTLRLSENSVTAAARGVTATNQVSASAATVVDGDAEERRYLGVSGNDVAVSDAAASTAGLEAFSQVTSVQRQTGDVSAAVGESADLASELSILAGAVTSSRIALDGNTVSATASGIGAVNTLSQEAGTAIADGSGASVNSVQLLGLAAAANTVEAAIDGLTVSSTTAGSGDSRLSVDGNALLAAATGASASNGLSAVAGTSLAGDGAGDAIVDGNDAAGALSIASQGDADVGSVQVSNADVTASIGPGSDGGAPAAADEFPALTLVTGAATGSTLSVDGNSQRAIANNLTVTNNVAVRAGTELASFNANALNAQSLSGSTDAAVSGGEVSLAAASLEGVASASGNLLLAAATGASATNSLAASAASMTGAGDTGALGVAVADGGGTPVIDFDGVTADPLLTVANVQSRVGDDVSVTASIADGSAAAGAGALSILAGVTADVIGTVTVADNGLLAQARGLQATNSLSAVIANSAVGASMAVGSVQTTEGALAGTVTASINPGATADRARVAIDAGSVTGVAANDRNTVQAAGLSNLASNSLSVTAEGSVSGESSVTGSIGSGQATSADGANALVANGQRATTAVNASVDNLDVETVITGTLNGTATVEGNAVLTDARNNYAVNSLSLQAGNELRASAQVSNSQSSSAEAGLSSVINGAAGATGRIGVTAQGDVTGTVRVDGNVAQASATSNQAINSLRAGAATLDASNGGSANVGAGVDGTANYVALNSQDNAASVSSAINAFTISASLAGGAGAVTGTASLSGNMIMASSAANVSLNTMTLDAAGNARADAVMSLSQANTGNVSARVTGASIVMTAGGASATGTFSVGGNRIAATAQGNVSSSTLGRSGSSFSNR